MTLKTDGTFMDASRENGLEKEIELLINKEELQIAWEKKKHVILSS